ncbi:CBM35 domain-containing protein [Streptomyces sp. HNM0574]|uniref:CBM35 domain-containing protein n=1 Tax=Streptomyces sp. HNM0574 TaxID=2714954 RepID=UPI00146A76FA|nr:CBM35 domain-containing protein [Streptomyces sp. HNM0574]NLU68066.1 carbohydrate-binding protein [Streptomyces sp. HNM0574]
MTAENRGTAPEGDDPFAHLYRQEGGGPAASQPGVPRRSYNQVRTVGERQYGGQQAHSTAGYPTAGQSSAHYAAPETVPGGRAAARQAQGGHGGAARGRRGNGLLIGAIAVVAAVVVGIGSAVFFNSDDGNAAGTDQAGSGSSAGAGDAGAGGGEQEPGDGEKQQAKQQDLPKQDAATLRLDGGTSVAKDVKGAQGKGGTYVAGLNAVGAKVTWNVKAPEAGKYKLKVRYGIPGEDANATLVVNGQANPQPLGMKNFIGSPKGDWEKGWQTTWAPVTLDKGANNIALVCGHGNKCNANLDQLWLAPAGGA